MPIPKQLLKTDDAFQLFLDVGSYASEWAQRVSGAGFDIAAWYKKLSPLDAHLALLSHFFGTWENSGDWWHQIECWQDQRDMVVAALAAFGCSEAGTLFDEGIKLHVRLGGAGQDTPEWHATRSFMDELGRAAK